MVSFSQSVCLSVCLVCLSVCLCTELKKAEEGLCIAYALKLIGDRMTEVYGYIH